MMKKNSRFVLFWTEILFVIYSWFHSVWQGFLQVWRSGWALLIKAVVILINALTSKQMLMVSLLVIIISVIFAPIQWYQIIIKPNERQIVTLKQNDLDIFIQYPKYIIGTDRGTVQISIQNTTRKTMMAVSVGILSVSGNLEFQEGSAIKVETLLPGESITKNVPFTVVPSVQGCVKTRVISKFEYRDSGKREVYSYSYEQNTPLLCRNALRAPIALGRKIPKVAQAITVSLGYLSAAIAALALFFGENIGSMLRKMKNWLQRRKGE